MTFRNLSAASLVLFSLSVVACNEALRLDDPATEQAPASTERESSGMLPATELSTERLPERSQAEGEPDVYAFADRCVVIRGWDRGDQAYLALSGDGRSYRFGERTPQDAMPFKLRAADLGTYLLFDAGRHFVTARSQETQDESEESQTDSGSEGSSASGEESETAGGTWRLQRDASLNSAEQLRIDRYRSHGEWELAIHLRDESRYMLRHGVSGRYLGLDGLVDSPDASAVIDLLDANDCAEFPELTLDAVGEVVPRVWEDGDLFGFVDAHSHLVTNKGFGGGGMFHGAPFHRLGVEHALSDCDHTHGFEGRRDLIGYFYDGDLDLDVDVLLPIISSRETPEFNHHTEGFPIFTEWPSSWGSSTHQVQYYLWLERAYRAGLRLVVELATGNSVLCEFITGLRSQTTLYSCNDMVGVDRAIESVREMERYIDAQSGGPGQGWFRIVESPEEAREVIRDGKLAVVLGIETSNLFDCYLSPPPGVEPCTPEMVSAALDDYYERGVRVIFPVHKYDNAFAPGDGQRGIIELGNLINSSHYSNFVEDCPLDRHVFDSGSVTFGGINRPREEYQMPPVLNLFNFANNPVSALLPLIGRLTEPGLPGNFCQNAGLTDLGRFLLQEIMARGMIVDIAHLPQFAVLEALDILEAAEYPASSTHGDSYGGRIFNNQGFARINFGGCADPDVPNTMGRSMRNQVADLEERGMYPVAGFAFDLNGFAGGRRPRFGENSRCPQPQPNRLTYPFTSFAGDVEFTQPRLGQRVVDFNTEGMIHVGLIPELIEEVRRDGMSDEELAPLFRSAEAWVRMWERAEERAAVGGFGN